jgi:hypothetical protein
MRESETYGVLLQFRQPRNMGTSIFENFPLIDELIEEMNQQSNYRKAVVTTPQSLVL